MNNPPLDWPVTLEMTNTNVTFKIDTGAQCNVLPERTLYSLSPPRRIKPAMVKLSTQNGTFIPVAG